MKNIEMLIVSNTIGGVNQAVSTGNSPGKTMGAYSGTCILANTVKPMSNISNAILVISNIFQNPSHTLEIKYADKKGLAAQMASAAPVRN
jgi:hypothetical protein